MNSTVSSSLGIVIAMLANFCFAEINVPLLWCSAPTYKHVDGGTVVIASNPLGMVKIRATGEDFGEDEDKLVIISDGSADGAQIVACWRDDIPTEFEQPAGTKSRRIADQIRLSISATTIDASPVVYGSGILVVNSTYSEPGPISMDLISNAFLAGTTRKAPRGIQKYEWNSDTHKLEESWAMTM